MESRRSGEGDLVRYLSCYIRQRNQRGEDHPLIDAGWRSIAERHRAVSFNERCERLLTLVAERAGHHSRFVKVDPWDDGLLVGEPFHYQFELMRLHLEDEGRIRIPPKEDPDDFYQPIRCGITPYGWLKYEKLRTKKRSTKTKTITDSDAPAEVSGRATESQEDREQRRRKWLQPMLDGKGWSRSKLAAKAGLDHKIIENYWHGRTKQLSPGSRKKIAEALGVEVAEVP